MNITPSQQHIFKKQPPPAPNNNLTNSLQNSTSNTNEHQNDNNGPSSMSAADQAPALPPKPSNQFSPHLYHHGNSKATPYPPLPLQTTTTTSSLAATSSNSGIIQQQPPPPTQQSTTRLREQAKVIYAYKPSNDDELALEVGDVIDIIEKEIEDQGWWRGELRGQIGVFPDNFVQLIRHSESSISSLSAPDQTPPPPTLSAAAQATTTPGANTIESKIKPVFDNTPKGFSKELENNIFKLNSPTSFLSLKLNKLQQQQPTTMATSEQIATPSGDENGKKHDSIINSMVGGGSQLSNTPKLEHMTANRAKGPSRRPPTSFLQKRAQPEPEKSGLTSSATNLPTTPITSTTATDNGHHVSPVVDQHVITPKTSQRFNQQPNLPDKSGQPETAAATTPLVGPVSTPSWMVDLKKVHAERRRDNPTTNTTTITNPLQAPINELATSSTTTTLKSAVVNPPSVMAPSLTSTTNSTASLTMAHQENPIVVEEKRLSSQSDRGSSGLDAQNNPSTTVATSVNSVVKNLSSRYSINHNQSSQPAWQNDNTNDNESGTHYESLVKQLTQTFQGEISELKEEVGRLRVELNDLKELKSVVEVMRTELKACQSATESQKKWMKDLVHNLADERKKIAAMQIEIDRNLK